MILHDTRLAGQYGLQHIHIQHGKIKTVTGERKQLDAVTAKTRFELAGATAFPGFINSHDHLDFNLFPPLCNRVYNNYTEWGKDIHSANSEIIKEVLKIPRALRIKWGLYKNLLNGFTTVVNHGEKLAIKDELVTVFQDCYPLHSPAFEKHWKWKLNNPLKTKRCFVMHIGEGTDALSTGEIDTVIRGNVFRKKIIAIHGVAMKPEQARAFTGLVWCPASNFFLLGKTADITSLKQKTKIVFGTDSTLTASWNAWDHFRQAKEAGITSATELLAMLAPVPAMLWDMPEEGQVVENKNANIIITKKTDTSTDQFFSLNPWDILLVIHNGQVRLIDESLISQDIDLATSFCKITMNGTVKFVQGDLALLAKEIRKYYPGAEFPFSE
jgi:cytosine/adenosine deaminase-related metal-dependent hydrolase